MKTVWIINHYAGNNKVGLEYRHFFIAKELERQNINVFIISSSYTHLLHKEVKIRGESELTIYDGIPYLWIKTPKYIGNKLSRFRNMIFFSYKLQRIFKKIDAPKPDFVIASSPHPFSILNGYFISKYYKAKFIFEERDVWPMAIKELLGANRFHPIVVIFQWLEDFAYKKSDLVLSPLVNLEKNISLRKIKHKNFFYLPNGILIKDMEELLKSNVNIDKYIPKEKFLIGFAGTVGASNCVDILLKSAKKLKNTNIGFIIIGDGDLFDEMKKYAEDEKLNNVYMLGKKDKKSTIKILDRCDVLYNGSPKSLLYSYGLSCIKLPEYMYLSKYIINAVDVSNDIVEVANCGSTIDSENVDELAFEIKKLSKTDKDKLDEFGIRGKNYIENNLTYPFLVKSFIEKLDEL